MNVAPQIVAGRAAQTDRAGARPARPGPRRGQIRWDFRGSALGTEGASREDMNTFHAAVWLDHSEARVFHIDKQGFDEAVIVAEHPHKRIHRKSGPGAVSGKRAAGDPAFYEEIAKAIAENEEILVLGPSTAKLELIKYVHKHHPAIEHKVVGVETVDHPSDRQVVAYARHYFDAADSAR
jgi:hypothetical protein